MRRIQFLLAVSPIVILATASLVLLLVVDSNKSSSNEGLAEGRSGDLILTMSVDKTTIRVGQSIQFNLTLKNGGEEDVNLSLGYPPFDICLRDQHGEILTKYTTGRVFPTLLMNLTLRPGENYSQIISWDLDIFNENSGRFDLIKPGEYEVSGVWLNVETRIETSKIHITVLKPLDESQAVEAAKDFLLNCPTFRFDGLPESVKVVEVCTLRSPWTWMVRLNFTCRHPGYGDRTGLILLQVLTDHEISIVVQKGVVISAIIDDVWDELNQRFIGENHPH
ncbi:MAG: BsuPI-related putative proteinase inhibitor [Candidatus Bathyarchaeia archaeon]